MDIKVDDLFIKYFPDLAVKNKLKVFQKKIISNIIKKNNTLCIMPTGGGKSWIYWLSGLSTNGITIVISPLIALIDEQSQKISEQGYNVLTLHSSIPANQQIDLLKKFYQKEINPDFIFVSPERIATDGLFEYCIKSRKKDIKLITIDEIHCVSQWGFDFRPFYKRIPIFLTSVFGTKWPSVLGLTATLNPKDIIEICSDFKIDKENIFKDELLVRSEIELKVLKFINENEKEDKLWQLLNIHKNDKTLVYLYRKYNKRGTEDLKNKAIEKGFKALNFHGDMTSIERQDIIDKFKNNEIDVVFATNAFGMGIDIPDIRVVIHFMIPESVEQYYQEVGRAARDKKASQAYILYSNKNIDVRKRDFIDKSFPDIEQIEKIHKKITNQQIGLKTLKYFDDEDIQQVLPYLLENSIISIISKTVTNIDMFKEIKNIELKKLYDLTKTKGIISIIKTGACDPTSISDLIFSEIFNESSVLTKSFDKCLLIHNNFESISADTLQLINKDIEEKRKYKHNLLDYFTYLLDNYSSSKELHQEIGLYLGVEKHLLNKIYKTLQGELVRSKSEVIIANLLHNESVKYEYEKKLFYDKQRWIEPDFTIMLNGTDYYWEHLGLIGKDSYDTRWQEKMQIYDKYYKDKLYTTFEGSRITDSAMELIKKFKAM